MLNNKQLKRDFVVYFLIFFCLSLPFFFTNLDIALQSFFYDPERGFFSKSVPFWDIVYKYGIFPGYFLSISALFFIAYSYWKPKLIWMRKWALMLVIANVLGPGLLVNATFKEHWGRPRPREIVEFGGNEQYVKPFVKTEGKGKSFPCGHASMGFFLSIPFLFLRNKYKKTAWFFFIGGILYGSLVGVARIVAGGHFASDVVWSAGMVWFAALIAYYALNVQKEVAYKPISNKVQKKKARRMTFLMGGIFPFLIVTALLATPYISKKQKDWTRAELKQIHMSRMLIKFQVGNIEVQFNKNQQIKYEVTGFGFPNSKFRINWQPGDTTKFWLDHLGWFTEIRNNIDITLPKNTPWQNHINLGEGDIFLTIPKNAPHSKLRINIEKGDLTLLVDEESQFALNCKKIPIKNNTTIQPIVDKNDSIFTLTPKIKKGKLKIERAK